MTSPQFSARRALAASRKCGNGDGTVPRSIMLGSAARSPCTIYTMASMRQARRHRRSRAEYRMSRRQKIKIAPPFSSRRAGPSTLISAMLERNADSALRRSRSAAPAPSHTRLASSGWGTRRWMIPSASVPRADRHRSPTSAPVASMPPRTFSSRGLGQVAGQEMRRSCKLVLTRKEASRKRPGVAPRFHVIGRHTSSRPAVVFQIHLARYRLSPRHRQGASVILGRRVAGKDNRQILGPPRRLARRRRRGKRIPKSIERILPP